MARLRVVLVSFNLDMTLPLSTAVLKAYGESRDWVRSNVEIALQNHLCYELDSRNRRDLPDASGILRSITGDNTGVIGFSTYVWNRNQVLTAAAGIKEQVPRLPVVLGGPEVTFLAEETLLANQAVDFVVRGEGEETLADLLEHLATGAPRLDAIPGLTYRGSDGGICSNPDRRPMASPGDHASPYRYLDEVANLDRSFAGLETARGCRNRCSYCGYAPARGLRPIKLERVLANIDTALAAGISMFVIHDPSLFADEDRALQILQYLVDSGAVFRGELNLEQVSERATDFLARHRGSYTRLGVGLQTTNPRAVELLDRPSHDLVCFETRARRLSARGVPLIVELISGLPGDDYAGFKRSIDFAFALQPSLVRINPLQVLPGTTLRQKAEEIGLIFEHDPPYRVVRTPSASTEELDRCLRLAFLVNNINALFAQRPCWALVNLILRMARVPPSVLLEDLAERDRDRQGIFSGWERFDWIEADVTDQLGLLFQLLAEHDPQVFHACSLEYLTELYFFLDAFGAYQEFSIVGETNRRDDGAKPDREGTLFRYPVHQHLDSLLSNRVPQELVQGVLTAHRRPTRIRFSYRTRDRFRLSILE